MSKKKKTSAELFFEKKAKLEGWEKQAKKPESEQSAADRFFEQKREREGW